jgi:hypothetical protein
LNDLAEKSLDPRKGPSSSAVRSNLQLPLALRAQWDGHHRIGRPERRREGRFAILLKGHFMLAETDFIL